ncbi:MAG: tRNA (guanosine(37)-N1)-methyltransferase TrmD [Lachnospiraceae bacterium]|nr:tRNA (guanosine(37)-N1)-methyltransferase TrmD [Lachnospiraceae bacterium]
MKFSVLTLFPEMICSGLNNSIMKRALDKGIISLEAVNIRDFTTDKHNKVDDYPYGGGAGMLMQAQPVYDACQDIIKRSNLKPRVLYMSPKGKTFNQEMAANLAKEEHLIFLCGHYEGIDQRVLDRIVTDEVSLGDFVLTGGELPSMVMIDCIARLIPGVLNNEESAQDESFSNFLLEYPQYTRPEEWMGERVPDVLLTGHHAYIEKWRLQKSKEITKEKRPDLYREYLKSRGIC